MGMGACADLGEPRCRREFKLRRWSADLAILTSTTARTHTKPTTLGRAALDSLGRALDELEARRVGRRCCSRASRSSSPPAPTSTSSRGARPGGRAGRITRRATSCFCALRALPFPTVAAVNGACLGGGVELALHCDARTISTASATSRSPECFLGIVPGWGGTQLCRGSSAPQAAVHVRRRERDAAEPDDRRRSRRSSSASPTGCSSRSSSSTSRSHTRASSSSRTGSQRAERRPLGRGRGLPPGARDTLDATVHGAAPAPVRALDLIEGAAAGRSRRATGGRRRRSASCSPAGRRRPRSTRSTLVERRAKRALGRPDAEPRRDPQGRCRRRGADGDASSRRCC